MHSELPPSQPEWGIQFGRFSMRIPSLFVQPHTVTHGRERVGQLFSDFEDLLDGEAALADQAIQWQLFDKLHRQEGDTVGFFHRVDRDNVRVVELRQNLRFSTKTPSPFGILRHLGR